MSYIDTSVIIAALDPLDPRQKLALKSIEEENDKKISELVLIELTNILSKKEEMILKIFKKLGLKEEFIIPTTILYLMKRFKLNYKKVKDSIKIPAIGELYSPMASAMNMSFIFKLKTLDLLHLAYIKSLMEQGENISKLITIDEDFKKKAKIIKQKLNLEVKILTINTT